MTTLLPPGKIQFSDANGVPLAGGSVFMYVPSTTSFKTTWLDPSQLAANTNPIILDAAGEAIIFGSGVYRQVLQDSLGNTIWDQLTASTDAGGIYSGGISTGTATDQVVASTTPAGFALTAGNQLTFIAGFTSTGATTLNANGTGAKAITKAGQSGPVALVAGDIRVGNAVELFYDGTQYQILSWQGGTLAVAINEAEVNSIAAAATTDIGAQAGNFIVISGNTGITSFGTIAGGARRTLVFTGTPTITASGNIILPASYAVVPGDVMTFRSEGGGIWTLESCALLSGKPLVVTAPVFGTSYSSGSIALPALGATTTLTHGLGGAPTLWKVTFVNVTAEGGYVTGDSVDDAPSSDAASRNLFIVLDNANTTQLKLLAGSGAYSLPNKGTGALFSLTAGNWNALVRAWR